MGLARRGILASAGAALMGFGAAKGRAAQAAQVLPGVGMPIGGEAGWAARAVASPIKADPEEDSLVRRALRATLAEAHDRRDRERALAARLGGFPPHLASMHACAPWFRVQRAMAWERERDADFQATVAVIHDQLYPVRKGGAGG